MAKFRQDLLTTSEEVITTSSELKKKSRKFHFLSVLSTTGAWSTRFLAINFLILAIVHEKVIVGLDHIIIWSRSITMHVITSFSPTPGAAGIAEYLFGGFFSDYIPLGIASLIALVWRLITYYPYLIAGAIIIPYWLKRIRSYNK